MTRDDFLKLSENYIYLDGATGSNLVRAGMPAGVCPEQWILEHRDIMLRLQKSYVEAGTDILYAPTFTANRVKLSEYGLQDRQSDMIRELTAISKEAAASAGDRRVYVAGDLTMTGEQLRPIGRMDLEELISVYKEQILDMCEAGADLLVAETMMSLAEIRAALIAAGEVCSLPVMVTITFEADGRTLYGTDARTAAVVLESLGACAIGVNCSAGPAHMIEIVREMAGVTKVPIIAKPNAGLPMLDAQGKTCYPMTAEEFVEEMRQLTEAGATVLGGCCGTTPEFIKGLRNAFGREIRHKAERRRPGSRFLASERRTVEFGLEGKCLIVGERINPTGKKLLQAQLREGSMDSVLQFAEEQEQSGAAVLDINMGMSGIDEKAMMLRAIEEVGGVTSLPLSLDSSHVEVLEAALRNYPGRALINSVSLEREKFEKLLPLAKKYGAMFILLPLSDKGLPESMEEKREIIETILERAYSLGMEKEDIVVDGLAATVGANKRAALETLETIRYCRERGLATICGLSNISFGMPERGYVNASFLTMAVREGLTMAIANPSQELLMSCALAAELLLAKEGADIDYIEYVSGAAARREKRSGTAAEKGAQGQVQSGTAAEKGAQSQGQGIAAAEKGAQGQGRSGTAAENGAQGQGRSGTAAENGAQRQGQEGAAAEKGVQSRSQGSAAGSPAEDAGTAESCHQEQTQVHRQALRNAVLKGNRNKIAAITREALAQGETPEALLHQVLLPAINEVGELFDKGKYFLPQLIGSAEAMKNAIEVLEPLLLRESGGADMPVVVIATVEGDIHDIGKNLVALMLKNYGFRVIDLGKDVPKEEIVRAARENHARIIALSALMTTTMQRMREVVAYAKEEKVSAKIMIGGAVITQDYADEIGADGYSRDAAEAVRVARRLIEEHSADHRP